MAEIISIKQRLKILNNDYLENAVCNDNPLINKIIEDYIQFKNRERKNNTIPRNTNDVGNSLKERDKVHNPPKSITQEKVPTILYQTEWTKYLLKKEKKSQFRKLGCAWPHKPTTNMVC